VRIVGQAGGGLTAGGMPSLGGAFVTCAELDALGPVPSVTSNPFDQTGDGLIDAEDTYALFGSERDLDLSGGFDTGDISLLLAAIRWGEKTDVTSDRR
jgi:hypothetical protein